MNRVTKGAEENEKTRETGDSKPEKTDENQKTAYSYPDLQAEYTAAPASTQNWIHNDQGDTQPDGQSDGNGNQLKSDLKARDIRLGVALRGL